MLLLVPVNRDIRFSSLRKKINKVWEKFEAQLKKEHTKGTPLPVYIWSTWPLIKSVLEPSQTSDSFDESDDDSFEKPQNQYSEANYQIMFNQGYKIGTGQKSTSKNLSFEYSRSQISPPPFFFFFFFFYW